MLVYQYDGSLDGFYCAVFRAVYAKETPDAVEPFDAAQGWLLPPVFVETEADKAARVRRAAPEKICLEALELTETVFCSCLAEKELHLLRFLLRGFREGGAVLRRGFGDPQVARLLEARRHLLNEAHLLKGFVRFADYGGRLAAAITPKNYVLPFLAPHFMARFRNEDFLIFDKTHGMALLYEQQKPRLVATRHIAFPKASEQELQYQSLWKRFYHTVAVEGRENPRCRMTHMPKRYWENMLEVRGELGN